MTATEAFSVNPLRSQRRLALLWLLVLAVAGYATYWNGLGGQYFSDNFQHAFDLNPTSPLHFFTAIQPYHGFYRPLESAVLIVIQNFFGLDTTPVILFLTGVHVLLAWIVWLASRWMNLSIAQACIASAFLLVSQTNASDINTVACVSNVLSVFFGLLAVLLFVKNGLGFSRWYVAGILCLFLSLASKEAGMAFVGMSLVVMAWHAVRLRPVRYGRLALVALPVTLLTIVYLVMRSRLTLQPIEMGTANYNMHIGLNIPRNIAMFMASAFISVPSPDVYMDMMLKRYIPLPLAAGIFTLCLGLVCLYGAWLGRRSPAIRGVMLFAVAAMFPMALINHVSEHQTYSALPFMSVLLGIGAGALLENQRRPVRYLVMIALAATLCVNIYAINHKATMIKASGEHTRVLLDQIVPIARTQVPPNGALLLLNPPPPGPAYSMYIMTGFNYIRYGPTRVAQEAGRNDISVSVIDPPQLDSALRVHPQSVVLTLKDGRVVSR